MAAALNRPLLFMIVAALVSAAAWAAAASSAADEHGKSDASSCNLGSHQQQQQATVSIFLYLAGFACAFVAGSMTNAQKLFHSKAGRSSSKAFRTDSSGTGGSQTLTSSNVAGSMLMNGSVEKSPWNQGLSVMEQLVPEITLHVLTYLDFKSLCCMSMTNIAMKKVANDESAWKALYHKDFNSEQSNIVHPNGWKSHYAVTKAVTEVNRNFYNKFRTKSLRGMSRLWLQADYVKSVHPGLELVSGYDAVMENWRLVFKWSQSMDLQLRDSKVRVMGDVAWVTNKATVNTATEPLVMTNCYELHNKKWHVVHHHCSPQIDFAYPDYNMLA